MSTLVTLELGAGENTLGHVRGLPVLRDLDIDLTYGLIPISPKKHLYVVRVAGEVDRLQLMAVPQVKGVHGDQRISTMHQEDVDQEDGPDRG